MQDTILLPTLVYGPAKPEIRFGLHRGRQVTFCLNNGNLHLTEHDLDGVGTYQAGSFLGSLCRQHCPASQHPRKPCPAFVSSNLVGVDDGGLATVEMHDSPQWLECGGVRKLVEESEMTEDEHYFFLSYLDARHLDEMEWRDSAVDHWNQNWHRFEDDVFGLTRAGFFNSIMWNTMRWPALIPQVWLNWYYAGPDHLLKEGQPSRVDFVAFANGKRHVVEIDGPSHYAAWKGHGYEPDEQEYARNLKIERWLRSEGFEITRIGRWEVREARGLVGDEFNPVAWRLMKVLPFGTSYSPRLPVDTLVNDCPF